MKHEQEQRNDLANSRRTTVALALALLTILALTFMALVFSEEAQADDDECEPTPYAGLYNISTRALVRSGAEKVVGGFIVRGDEELCVVVRGRGPSVPLPNATLLPDPKLRLFDQRTKAILASNDNWQDGVDVDVLEVTGMADVMTPSEAAIFACLPPGGYTAQLVSADGKEGIGIVEVFDIFWEYKMPEPLGCKNPPPPERRCNEEDDDRGHGNDCDRDDEDNPGRGNKG